MTQMRTYFCEVCGTRKHAGSKGWYLVLENQWRDNLEILVWDEAMAAQPEMMHFCCAEHVQQRVSEWMRPGQSDYPLVTHVPSPQSGSADDELICLRRAALQLGRLSVDRAMLAAQSGQDREGLMAVLDAIEAVLQTPDGSPDAEEDAEEKAMLAFDA